MAVIQPSVTELTPMFDIILYICKRLRAFGIISFSFFLVACGLETNRLTDGQGEYMADPVQVALLIPSSAEATAPIAASLENAARLAVADLGKVKIDLRVYDTAGNTDIAARQAQRAVKEGAKIIIGPLYGGAANAAGLAVANKNVNILSFSNNSAIAGGNVFVLGKTFDNTAKRIVEFAAAQGKMRAIIVHPNNVEGSFGRLAIERAAMDTPLEIVATQSFEFSQDGVVNAVPLIRAAVEIEEADLIFLTSTTAGALGLLVQMLPEAGVQPDKVQFAGLARWDVPAQNLALPGVQGGWFALPDYRKAERFSARYKEAYGTQPHQLAGLAYDGIAAVGALLMAGQSDNFNRSALTQMAGFEGVDGIFRLNSEGTNERGLAIAKVFNKRVVILDPAPSAFDLPGF